MAHVRVGQISLVIEKFTMKSRSRLLKAFTLAAIGLGTHAGASEAQDSRLLGQVLSAATQQPLAGVLVEAIGTPFRTVTDERGRFILKLESGEHTLNLQLLGYHDVNSKLVLPRPGDTITLLLSPDPVLLEAVIVTVDRLEARTRAVPYSVRSLDAAEIRRHNTMTAYDVVHTRLATFTTCRRQAPSRPTCIRSRGAVSTPTVFIDERKASVEELLTLPSEVIHRVEVLRGTHIRVYTTAFMRMIADKPQLLRPIIM